jgi:hypothetical protein
MATLNDSRQVLAYAQAIAAFAGLAGFNAIVSRTQLFPSSRIRASAQLDLD